MVQPVQTGITGGCHTLAELAMHHCTTTDMMLLLKSFSIKWFFSNTIYSLCHQSSNWFQPFSGFPHIATSSSSFYYKLCSLVHILRTRPNQFLWPWLNVNPSTWLLLRSSSTTSSLTLLHCLHFTHRKTLCFKTFTLSRAKSMRILFTAMVEFCRRNLQIFLMQINTSDQLLDLATSALVVQNVYPYGICN